MTPVSIVFARKIGAIDIPSDERRMHEKPIPRFGGMAIFIAFMVTLLICKDYILVKYEILVGTPLVTEKLTAVLLGGLLIYLVGVVDDLINMRALLKLVGQIGCAAVAFILGIRIPAINILGIQFQQDQAGGIILSFLITVVWIVLITNTINLIDGLDGLAAGVAAIASLAIAYAAYIHGFYVVTFSMMALAGSAIGFLPFNFYPAKVFMGDSGSMFLGFILASISIIGPAKGATIMATAMPMLVLAVPIFDVGFAMIRRMAHGRSIFEPDKGHLHHQLARIGMGQRRSVLMLYGVSGVMGISAISFSRAHYVESGGLFVIAMVFIMILIWDWNKNEGENSTN
jgi:UDP-GlcNAc:undecaprenyl-phosphate GlcNAc-1-phosphate transferase